jgi:chromosome partitioning protein
MKVLSVCNKKGGAGKTTLAVGLASCLPGRVGLIDLDENGSALRWMEDLDLFDVASGSADSIVGVVPTLVDEYDWLVLDTPPNDAKAITQSASAADLVLIPLAPSPLEADQLPDTLALLPEDRPYLIVPSRVRLSTSSGKAMREMCEQYGHPVTTAVLPLSERIVQSFGATPIRIAFRPLAEEIVQFVERENR